MTRDEAKDWISKTCGIGWLGLIDKAYDAVPAYVQITDVYQKWAALPFDINCDHEEFEIFLLELSEKSESISEVCGKPANHVVIGNWEHTRCKDHSEGSAHINNLASTSQ